MSPEIRFRKMEPTQPAVGAAGSARPPGGRQRRRARRGRRGGARAAGVAAESRVPAAAHAGGHEDDVGYGLDRWQDGATNIGTGVAQAPLRAGYAAPPGLARGGDHWLAPPASDGVDASDVSCRGFFQTTSARWVRLAGTVSNGLVLLGRCKELVWCHSFPERSVFAYDSSELLPLRRAARVLWLHQWSRRPPGGPLKSLLPGLGCLLAAWVAMWSNFYELAPRRLRRWVLACNKCDSPQRTTFLGVAAHRSSWHLHTDDYIDDAGDGCGWSNRAWCGKCCSVTWRTCVLRSECLVRVPDDAVLVADQSLLDDVCDVADVDDFGLW